MERKQYSAYGVWEVTTEGDVEGRTVTHLGIHTGYLDEIAFKLAKQSFYGLRFKQLDPAVLDYSKKTGTKAIVSLDIDSGTWDMSKEKRIAYFQNLLEGRKVTVSDCGYYACVTLYDGDSPQARALREKEMRIEMAKAKLTSEELVLLGLQK